MVHLSGGHWGQALLLEYVFLEIVTVLRLRRDAAVAGEVAEQLLQAREVDFVPCSDFFLETLSTFRAEAAPLSFVDAAIVTLARRDRKGAMSQRSMRISRTSPASKSSQPEVVTRLVSEMYRTE